MSVKKVYELALSDNNRLVFKNPEKALKQLKKDYKKTIKEIRKQFDLDLFFNKYTYEGYHNLAWQIVTDDNKLSDQAQMVSHILGIYENSFNCK